MEEIKHRIALGRLPRNARVVACWKVNAVVDRVFENPAVKRVAVNAALRCSCEGNEKCGEQNEDSKPAMHRSSLLVA
jgi:hypothetical protein